MSQILCPLCGKFTSARLYNPEDFTDDILRVQVRGKGRAKGTKREWSVSIFDDENDPVYIKIRDRIAKLYSLFGDEAMSDEEEKILDDINAALEPYYEDPFDNLISASLALLDQFLDYEEEDEQEEEESLSALEKELRLAEEEDEDEN